MNQARSVLGMNATTSAITEWLATHKADTRESLTDEAAAPSRFARALKALRLAMGSVLLGMGVSR